MKFNFRKIAAIATSALLTGMTMGVAAAANYPAPFISGSTSNVAIVYGTGAGMSSLDIVEAGNIQSDLSARLGTGSGTGATVAGTAWQAKTSSDPLEINEPINKVATYIDDSDLAILADGSIVNEKGTSTYKQSLYFDDVFSAVNYTEDDNDKIGLFYTIVSGRQIARYVIDFTNSLQTDVASNTLNDIQDKDIQLMGKTYTITNAVNSSSGHISLTLMSGAEKSTIESGEEMTVGGYVISAVVSSSSEVRFVVDGKSVPSSGKMAEGGI